LSSEKLVGNEIFYKKKSIIFSIIYQFVPFFPASTHGMQQPGEAQVDLGYALVD